MINIIDTYPKLMECFTGGTFQMDKWEAYMEEALPGASPIFLADMKDSIDNGGYSWEEDYLPVLNAVAEDAQLREQAHEAFCKATDGLEEKLLAVFGKSVDANIVFYLGLCNGAGWVTGYDGKTTVFLGIEKIMELEWCEVSDMYGLIYHELGHVYQKQHGVLDRTFNGEAAKVYLWKLFIEGVAMYFEQALVGDFQFYHEDKDGWKAWCDANFDRIKQDFAADLPTMGFANQRYFGDWVSYMGHGDVGYYLGCRFLQFICSKYKFDDVINYDIGRVETLYERFNRLG